MLIKFLNRTLAKVTGKAPVRTILIVPFVLQIVGAVGLVGYLSFRNGQQAVNEVASHLRENISDRVKQYLNTYLATPHLINPINMEYIHANTYTTILLCAATLFVTTGIGILTARWITKTILQLNIAAKEIAKGEWNKTVEIKSSDEVSELANSFDSMAAQLQASFTEVTALNETLAQSDRKFRAIFNQTFQLIGMVSIDGILLEANQTALDFGGLQREDVIGKLLWECYWWTISEATQTQLQDAIERARRGEFIRYEVEILGFENRVVSIDFSLKPIGDDNGNVEFLILEGRDITERKQARSFLAEYHHNLEAKVAERTAQLLVTNEQLKREIVERKQVEQALRESEERFREIAGTISQFFFVRSASSGQFHYVSPAYEKIWGRTCGSLYHDPKSWLETLHPDDHELVLDSLTEQFKGNSVKREYRIIRADGSIRWIAAEVSVVRDDAGQPLRFVGLAEDISDRKRAEAEIICSKDLLESIFNESTDAIFLVNAETLLITDCNRRAVELFEASSKDELLNIEGRTLQKESFTSEELESIVGDIVLHGFWSRELEYVTKKGKIFWGNLAVKEIYVAGQKIHLVRVTDITKRKQAELALQEREYRLRTLGDNLPNGMIYQLVHEPSGNTYFSYISAGIEHLLGVKPEAVMQDASILHNLIFEEDRLLCEELTEESRHNLSIFEMQMRKRTTQGNLQWSYLRSAPRRLEDGRTVWDGIEMDITNLKLAEKALQENALREQAIVHVLQRMRQTLDIETIFNSTTEELRQVLKCDRVAIYRLYPDWSGEFIAESVANGWVSLVTEQKKDPQLTKDALEDENCQIKALDIEDDLVKDTYLQDTKGGVYSQGASYRVIEDIYKARFAPCYINLLERFQAKAYIIVPIFCGRQLWGLLATYQNSNSRAWSEAEISIVVQIGTQLGIALQQAQLLEETQQQAVALKLALDELKRTQLQLIQAEKMSSLGQMIAGIAHEINNPVSFIYGNLTPARHYFQDLLSLVELYQQTYLNPPREIQQLTEEIDIDFLLEDWSKLMDSMEIGAERIGEIVRSLRNFSRLDEQELKPVDIHEGIDNTLLILQHRLRAEGASEAGRGSNLRPIIEVIKDYGQLPAVTCYAGQLNQVIMNLLNNAIDALENQPAPRVITIRTSVASCHGSVVNTNNQQPITNCIVIRIADNGSGMNEEVRKKVFDPFFTTKPVGSGTGLGLSISYQIIVEKHKGYISCVSALGQGTEFIVEIPVRQT
ncbi:MAG TPA: hypothetical protein DCE56_31170 [Cyanobacteria bacterium UBA8553]|nr:hypothetical protein [Cyanobacteria bacterium UBA8553]